MTGLEIIGAAVFAGSIAGYFVAGFIHRDEPQGPSLKLIKRRRKLAIAIADTSMSTKRRLS